MEGLTVHVITNGDKQRITSTSAALDTYKLAYTFHHFEKHPTDGRLGCYLSHIALFNYAKKNNMEYIAIAEDNLKVTCESISHFASDIRNFLNTPDWEILYLGGFTFPFDRYTSTPFSSIFKTSLAHGTGFYIIHRRLYEKVLDLHSPVSEDHIDLFIWSITHKPYIVYPMPFHRNNSIPTTVRYSWNYGIDLLFVYAWYILRNTHIIRFAEDISYYWIYFYLAVILIIIFIALRLFNMKGMPVSASNETSPGRTQAILSAATRALS